ncbi:venom dipeptidyl peptidase 4-like [Schistocerca americana]|uniref:venom dipeptidyl peptidase 4-like n=1 Tax=Schistocerca americana TaxID=7009 RepID=UPI001F4F7B3C|nr:venom dipeptidyl peptidase 4-like [Schistocerca americana]
MAATADPTQRRRRGGGPLPAVDLRRHLCAAAAAVLLLAQLATAACESGRRKTATAPRAGDEPFCLQECISGEMSAEGFDATWVGESKLFHAKDGQMVVTDINTNESTVVVPTEILQQYQPELMSLSADERYVLLGYNVRKVYRHSSEANYTIYSVQENTTYEICEDGMQLAKWAPVGNAMAFVYQNNLFYLRQPGDKPTAITADGVPGTVYNGAADWVYEEEVLASDSALWWSPDGSRVAFAHFDDSRVHNASYMHYGHPGRMEDQYSQVVTLRYPKAGTTNPTVQLKVAVVDGGTTRARMRSGKGNRTSAQARVRAGTIMVLPAPTDVVSEDLILYAVTWASPDTLLASWANRVGNVVQFVSYNTSSGGIDRGLKETRPDGWIEVTPAHFRAGNESSFVTIAWEEQADDEEEASFPQVVAVTNGTKKPLTSGRITVTKIYGWDPKGYVWFQATEALEPTTAAAASPSPSRRQVFAVREGAAAECVSCRLTTAEGQPCRYASASFSTDYSWMALSCSGPMDPPLVTLFTTADQLGLTGWSPHRGDLSGRRPPSKCAIAARRRKLLERARSTRARQLVWTDNADLRQKLASKAKPQVVDTWVEVAGGAKAQVRMLLPPDMDTSGAEQRPALVHVYAGPGSQQISDSFTIGFQHYMVTYRRYIYIYIDGRGSNCKGDHILFSVNRHLGDLEIQDQINVTRQLKQKYPYIDGSRTAIWGWSYGGYATAMTLAKDNDSVFRCGVSVAPVSSWIYYDSIYTERYMGLPTPQDNEAGYNGSDVTRLAGQFTNKTYFLIHGTADDNVHYQHSMMLARALEDAGVLFRQQSYPDQDHSMGSLIEHLYSSLDEFLLQCFNEDSQSVSSATRISGGLLAARKYVL